MTVTRPRRVLLQAMLMSHQAARAPDLLQMSKKNQDLARLGIWTKSCLAVLFIGFATHSGGCYHDMPGSCANGPRCDTRST